MSKFDRLFLSQQPIQSINAADAVVIGLRVFIQRQKKFRIMIPYLLQRSKLSLQGSLFAYSCRYLIISASRIVHGDKIHFLFVHFTDIYRIPAPQKLQIYDIFQNVPHIDTARTEQRITQSDVYDIIFFHRFQILLSLLYYSAPRDTI